LEDPPGYTILLLAFSGGAWLYTVSAGLMIVLLLAAAMVSASEIAFFSLRHNDLDQFRQSTVASEQRIAELLQKPRSLLATMRIAGVFVTVALLVLTYFLVRNSEDLPGVVFIIPAGVVAVLFTPLADLIPRSYSSTNSFRVARLFSHVWQILAMVLRPFVTVWLKFSSLVDRSEENIGFQDTADELNQALEMAAVNHGTTEDEKEILRGIVNFGTLNVKQVMRTRSRISAADISLTFRELMDFVSRTGYSRVPVYRKSLDRIEGILHIKDLLPFMDTDPSFAWQSLLRPGFFIPGAKKLDSLLKDFQEKHVHMAIVVNEYGGTLGLITLEDIIEEIIGDINDEFDEVGLHYQKVDEKTFVFEGKISLHDFCKLLNVDSGVFDPVRGASKSLAGLILEINRELPKTGKQINYERFTFVIESADRKRIKRVKVSINDREEI
jgi:gliding motility-associated protein GldE